ncbi:hypothetical protein BJ944DRAFT_184766 [Cunninghamella echinulata]|nr:hypothetical protein BJ944DRAFT_184766 [Cunninghamella echinulata]
MLPQLGLFKKVPCPLLPDCSRPTCIFSHDPKLKRPFPSATAATPEENQSYKRQRPNNITSQSTSSTKTTHDLINSIVKKNTQTQNNSNPDHDKKLNRTAHKPMFTGPPTISANVSSHTALKIRQTISNKLFEHYSRIYPTSIHGHDLAIQYTLNEERQLLEKTTNTAGYKQQAMSVLMQLKKTETIMKVDVSLLQSNPPEKIINNNKPIKSDIPSSAPLPLSSFQSNKKEFDYNTIEELILTTDQLKSMGYPLLSDIDQDDNDSHQHKNPSTIINLPSSSTIKQQRQCDRCHKSYTVKSILNDKELKACQYHFGRLRVVQSFGDRQRTYTCCNDPIGAPGCQQGSHVFKEEDIQSLHRHIPFIQSNSFKQDKKEKKAEKLLALDCEMGYTTIGMELIRLTVINDQMETIIDEKVLPSHMIIDLNTRYSGITTLGGVTHNLASIQDLLGQYMDQDTILLGHGLENDLKALRIIHHKVIDTAQLYPHPSGLPFRYGLRTLATKHLSKFIQDSSAGHDSYEDSKTCLELLYHYLEKQKKGNYKMD